MPHAAQGGLNSEASQPTRFSDVRLLLSIKGHTGALLERKVLEMQEMEDHRALEDAPVGEHLHWWQVALSSATTASMRARATVSPSYEPQRMSIEVILLRKTDCKTVETTLDDMVYMEEGRDYFEGANMWVLLPTAANFLTNILVNASDNIRVPAQRPSLPAVKLCSYLPSEEQPDNGNVLHIAFQICSEVLCEENCSGDEYHHTTCIDERCLDLLEWK